MVPRFYAPSLDPEGNSVRLPDDEAAHVVRVLRLRAGAPVRVFDGRGLERAGQVGVVSRDAVIVELGARVATAGEPRVLVTLAQSALKADKMDDVVRDAVMIGVTTLQPILTSQSDVPAHAFDKATRIERWQRIAVASAKQCGRAVVTSIRPACTIDRCLLDDTSAMRVMLVEPRAVHELEPGVSTAGEQPRAACAAHPAVTNCADGPPASALLLVGPEGGWSAAELDLARRHGCRALTLGSRTLRADAAALVAIAVLQDRWGEY